MPTILLVDDEKNIRATLARGLQLEGYNTLEAENGHEALAKLAIAEVDAMVLDWQMPQLDGPGTLAALAQRGSTLPVIVLTAHGTIERAVQAVRAGAFDFVEKPPSMERILVAVQNALHLGQLTAENAQLARAAGLSSELLGDSPPMQQLRATLARVGATDVGVLLLGENGAGKELAARALQTASARRRKPFVVVNCAAIPESLFESELFGHARGAFTGATEARRGKFQQADHGTLFLDEVGEIPLNLQPKLLRALESGEVERVGGGNRERVDVRVIAATNRQLEAEVAAGRFRQDLYFRLAIVPIALPSLRQRPADIPLLAQHFLEVAAARHRVRRRQLTEAALARLRQHHWPGNVRELRNALERATILASTEQIDERAFDFLDLGPQTMPVPDRPIELATALAEHERLLIERALARHGGKVAKAAEELGLERSHLYKKLRALGIEPPSP